MPTPIHGKPARGGLARAAALPLTARAAAITARRFLLRQPICAVRAVRLLFPVPVRGVGPAREAVVERMPAVRQIKRYQQTMVENAVAPLGTTLGAKYALAPVMGIFVWCLGGRFVQHLRATGDREVHFQLCFLESNLLIRQTAPGLAKMAHLGLGTTVFLPQLVLDGKMRH